eukprot:sb/3475238/
MRVTGSFRGLATRKREIRPIPTIHAAKIAWRDPLNRLSHLPGTILALGLLSNHPETQRDISSRSHVIINPGGENMCVSALNAHYYYLNFIVHVYVHLSFLPLITGERLEISFRVSGWLLRRPRAMVFP